MSVQITTRHTGMFLAGIQTVFVDSGLEHAGMTMVDDCHLILDKCT
jgi:hypothetical protein